MQLFKASGNRFENSLMGLLQMLGSHRLQTYSEESFRQNVDVIISESKETRAKPNFNHKSYFKNQNYLSVT